MAYPSFLPLPVRSGYSAGPNQPFSRTAMDDGQYSQVRRWSNIPMAYKLSWRLNFLQAQLFDAWIEYDCGRGVGPMQIPVADGVVTCKPITGEPLFTLDGHEWDVDLDVIEYRNVPKLAAKPVVLPTWPAGLPGFESKAFQYSKSGSMLVSDKSEGPSESRVRFRDRVSRNSATVLLTLAQRNLFWSFYSDSLLGGVTWFYGEFSNAYSQDRRRVRFVSPPQETPAGALFTIKIVIESARAPMMTTAEYRSHFELINDYVVAGYVESGYVGYYSA